MENAKNLLQKSSIRPQKLLGQNFLIDKKTLKKIIDAADLSPKDLVLEIGPGTGILTQELAKKAKRVIAVEKDRKMVEILEQESKEYDNIEIMQGDILEILKIKNQKSKLQFKNKKYKIVANIPYYLTSNLIRRFLESSEIVTPKAMVLMVQKEVAERICAKPPDMSLLAVSVQFYAKAEIVGYVSKKAFWPVPKVDSAIIKIAPLIYADRKKIDADLFFKIVKAGFSQPRKQLLNNFANGLKIKKDLIQNWLLKNKIGPTRRAETLSMQDWINLYNSF